jgi:hypothetical protein
VAFSPDGRRIATGGLTVRVWDAANGQPLFPLEGHRGAVSRLAFSRDGHWILTGGTDMTARLWDADTGKLLMTLRGHTQGLLGVAFSPDGRRVVTAGGPTAKIWDLATTNVVSTLTGHSGSITSIAFSPDGRRILTGSADHTAWLWDANSGTKLLILNRHIGVVSTVNFSPDGRRLLTGSWDQTAKVWDAVSGEPLLTFKGHTDNVTSVSFSPDGSRVLTSSRDATANLYDAARPDQVAEWRAEETNAQEKQATLARQQASADERLRASTAQDPGAIKQWLVLGPLKFEGGTGAEAMAQEQIGNESQLRPSDGQPSQVGGKTWTWQVPELDDYRINLFRVFRAAPPWSVAYLACYIRSDVDRADVAMKVGSEDQSKIYLNGKELYRYERPRQFVADQDVVSGVNLKAGTNVLLFKSVYNEEGEWRASLRFTDSAGQPLKGIAVTFSPL